MEKGAVIGDAAFRTILIVLLPKSWNTVIAEIYALKTTKDVIAALTIHWDRLVLQKQKVGILATALQAQTNQSKLKLVCVNLNCQQTGHVIKNCYWKGGGKQGLFPPNFQNQGKISCTLSNETPGQQTIPAANIAISITS